MKFSEEFLAGILLLICGTALLLNGSNWGVLLIVIAVFVLP